MRDRDRLIARARRTCNDCGKLLPIETVEQPRLKYCEDCSEKRRKESARLRQFDLYHRRKNGIISPESHLVDFVCQECGVDFQHPIDPKSPNKVKRFCDACIEEHRVQTLENRKEKQAEYNRQYRLDGRKRPKSEKEKEHNKEYMREYRKRGEGRR